MRWPSQLRRRLCIVMIHSSVLVLVYSSMLVIFLGQCMPRIFLRCLLWNVLIVFSNVLVGVHRSLLYRNALATYALKVLMLTALLMFLLSKNLFSVLKAYTARIFSAVYVIFRI